MEIKVKELLSLLRKERIIITKMVESDEKNDRLLFNALQGKYRDISLRVDELIINMVNEEGYDKSIEYLSSKIDRTLKDEKSIEDLVTLLGLINSYHLNDLSNKVGYVDSDAFTNEFTMQLYDIYLWRINELEDKELINSMRVDIVMKLVNSRAIRNYFRGDYEKALEISDPENNKELDDRNRMGTVYASMMLSQIDLSNKFEMYDGILDKTSYESRKKLLEIEFAAISMILMRRGFLIPPNTMEYSDYTENIIRNASSLANQYQQRNTKEQPKILIK